MARSIIRVRKSYTFNYDLPPEDSCGELDVRRATNLFEVFETLVPYTRRARKEKATAATRAAMPFAQQIAAHLQKAPGTQLSEWAIAKDMIATPGYVFARTPNGHRTLAFGVIRRIDALGGVKHWLGMTGGYAFDQLGVTYGTDLRQAEVAPDLARSYEQAAAAVLHCAISGLNPQADIYICDHPGDTRAGYLFADFGFMREADSGEWGSGEANLVAKAGAVCTLLAARYQFESTPVAPSQSPLMSLFS